MTEAQVLADPDVPAASELVAVESGHSRESRGKTKVRGHSLASPLSTLDWNKLRGGGDVRVSEHPGIVRRCRGTRHSFRR